MSQRGRRQAEMDLNLDPYEKIVCPYDKSHVLERHRMAIHTVRCKLNYPEFVGMKTCKYNSIHVVHESDYNQHLIDCPDRHIKEAKAEIDQAIPSAPGILPVNENIDKVKAKSGNNRSRRNKEEASAKKDEDEEGAWGLESLAIKDKNDEGDGWGNGEWEDKEKAKTYKPLEVLEDHPVIVNHIGLSKAKKKSARAQERKRYNAKTNKKENN